MAPRSRKSTPRRKPTQSDEQEQRHAHLSPVQHFFYGHARVPAATHLLDAWKAVKVTAAAAGPLDRSARFCLHARMCATGAPPGLVSEVLTWSESGQLPGTMLARIPAAARPATAVWVVYEALSVVMAEARLRPDAIESVATAAVGLGPAREVVDALVDLCREEAALRRRRIDVLSLRTESGYRADLL
ncbi:MAG: hypothetical protein IT373_13555 [Polyangiaceae bacterium]|nr:hypothetical protein [Polyangiaceae bacterium]